MKLEKELLPKLQHTLDLIKEKFEDKYKELCSRNIQASQNDCSLKLHYGLNFYKEIEKLKNEYFTESKPILDMIIAYHSYALPKTVIEVPEGIYQQATLTEES